MAPLKLLLFIALCGLGLVLSNAWLAALPPWLGFSVESCREGAGICIQSVSATGPAQGSMVPGTRMLALSDGGRSIQADRLWLVEYPYELTTFLDLNRFIANQHELNAILSRPALTAKLENGTEVKLGLAKHRPYSDLPPDFWLTSLIGYCGFLISSGVWVFRKQDIAARMFALSGCGFLMLTLGIANFSNRELAAEAGALPFLLRAERIGDFLLSYSLVALLWYYPNTLTRLPAAKLSMSLMVSLLLNDALQFYQFPLHTFMVPDFLIPFVFCTILAMLQWRRSRSNPVNRAAFRWFLLALFPGAASVLFLEYFPALVGGSSATPLWLELAAILVFYLGIALGISKYRLFDLDNWWLDIWLWLIGSLVVFGLDLLVISSLGSRAGEALWLAAVIIAWCYLPVRQKVWKYFVREHQQAVEAYIGQINGLFAYPAGGRELDKHWRRLLRQVFDPLDISVIAEPSTIPEIRQDGFVLAVPGIRETEMLILTGRNRGRRLFTKPDQRLAETMLELARQSKRQQRTYLESVQSERVRILRDLHDDVAAPLMMLAHQAENPGYRKLAGTALSALRETVYGLQQPEPMPLADVMADWRAEVRDRLEAAGVLLEWEECQSDDVTLTPHERINLSRVIREAVSNTLHHAHPHTVKIRCDIESESLRLLVADDGIGGNPDTWVKHTGLASMQGRIAEMGGKIFWRSSENGGTQVELVVPLRSVSENSEIPLNTAYEY